MASRPTSPNVADDTLSIKRKETNLAKETSIDLALAFAFLGGLIGSLVGMPSASCSRRFCRAARQHPNGYIDSILASATTNYENWANAIYSLVKADKRAYRIVDKLPDPKQGDTQENGEPFDLLVGVLQGTEIPAQPNSNTESTNTPSR